jgi:tRNA nucleotidyltransferase/poly(A) polymerase
LTLYIDAEGNVYDPTGFALINLRTKHLSGVNAPADMFKEDPLVILRAIYLATKRDLKINSLRKIIKTDRHLLIPRATNSTLPEERLFNPRRFNLRFAKLFTQKLASKNLELLKNLRILEVLFPDIYPDLLANYNWLTDQIKITNEYVWPKIAIIYANFIACAVVLRVPENELTYLPAQMFPSVLRATVHHIWSTSYLFQDTFIDPDNLYSFLKRPLQEWRSYLGPKPATTSVSMRSPIF